MVTKNLTENRHQQWTRTPLKKEESEYKERTCRISHLLWVRCASWTEIIYCNDIETYIYISCSTEIHDWLIEECACLPFGWPTLVVAVPKGNWQRGYKQRGTSDSRRSQFFSPESFPADGSCDLANFGSGWVFRSTRDYQNPFPLHTILPFQIFNFSSPAEAAAGKVRNWFVGKKSNK